MSIINKLKDLKNVSETDVVIVSAIEELCNTIEDFKSKADTNKDGIISVEEIKAGLKNPIGRKLIMIFIWITVQVVIQILALYLSNGLTIFNLLAFLGGVAGLLIQGYSEQNSLNMIAIRDRIIEMLLNKK